MRAVIDTCVVVDALQKREPFCKDAETVFLLCANRQYEGFLTSDTVKDIYDLTYRQTQSDMTAKKIMSKLCALFGLMDTAALDIRKAISAETADYDKAVMIETAVRSGADCIVTRNIKDFIKAPIPVYDPAKFIELLTETCR